MKIVSRIYSILSKMKKSIQTFDLEIEIESHLDQSRKTKILCKSNQNILHALQEHKIDITYYCNGNCSCGTCRIEVIHGKLVPPKAREQLVLGDEKLQRGDRLACQTYLESNATIKIPKYF